jgi:hypothetical protein
MHEGDKLEKENGGVLEFVSDLPMTPSQRKMIDQILEETKMKIRVILSSQFEGLDEETQAFPIHES